MNEFEVMEAIFEPVIRTRFYYGRTKFPKHNSLEVPLYRSIYDMVSSQVRQPILNKLDDLVYG